MPHEVYRTPPPAGRLTRRRLVALGTLAAAALPLSAWPGRALAGPDEHQAYQRAFLATLAAEGVAVHAERGREFLYRPGQLLVATGDVGRVVTWLREHGHPADVGEEFAGVVRLRVARDCDIPGLVSRLREPTQWRDARPPEVQPHHVLVGFGNIMGNPGGPPAVAQPLPPPDPARAGEGAGVTVGVCDTGIWSEAATAHPQWLAGGYLTEADDEDPLYAYDDVLALQAGHGTFVAGVLRQAAPGVTFDPEAALGPTGIGDEETLVAALFRLHPDVSVINLSLGCFTHHDVPPLPLVNAVAALPKKVVVVAAAGNAGVSRPSWPAALGPVLAVGAATPGEGGALPAPYSGFGPWVDASARGAWTSTYVKGRLRLPGLPDRHFAGYADWAGTSFAAAYVSGRLAAVMAATGCDAEQARSALLSGPVWQPGYGVLVE